MLCRYQCEGCGRWHLLSNISEDALFSAWLSFMIDPPPPFDRRTWDIIIKAEMYRRHKAA